MCIDKNGVCIQTGDHVRYKTYDTHSCFDGRRSGKVLVGKVVEIFDSMDQIYKCLWIEGERELIREDQIIDKIEKEDTACTGAEESINGICSSCARLGTGCKGTTNSVWTGCVHRIPEHLLKFTVVRQQTDGYTPSDLMYGWAKENGGQFYHTHFGSARLIYHGKIWEYDHWRIVKNEDGTENTTLYLIEEKESLWNRNRYPQMRFAHSVNSSMS